VKLSIRPQRYGTSGPPHESMADTTDIARKSDTTVLLSNNYQKMSAHPRLTRGVTKSIKNAMVSRMPFPLFCVASKIPQYKNRNKF
jgi:hypothetical protein